VTREKLLDRIRRNPNDVRFGDILKLLEDESFALRRVKGSHHISQKDDIIFVVPVHQNRVKSVYVKRLIEIMDEYGKR
jgi:predicted RNA binding protein YcfA (HicA-like mRNA interferase family)